jgi:hypothetical protein
MLERMSKAKRRSRPRAKQVQPDGRVPSEPADQAQGDSQTSPSQVLELIKHARVAQRQADAELASLVDHAVGLGVGWPEIAAQLGVTR